MVNEIKKVEGTKHIVVLKENLDDLDDLYKKNMIKIYKNVGLNVNDDGASWSSKIKFLVDKVKECENYK